VKSFSPSIFCLVTGLIAGVLLWWLGDETSAIILFVAEALGWASLYALGTRPE